MFKLVLEMAEEPEIKLPTSAVLYRKSKRVPEKHLFLLYWLHQRLWLCGSQQTVENSKRDENTRPPDLPPEKSVYAGQEATVRTRHGTTDWFQIRKEYIKAVYCHPAYLTYMQSTSWEMLGWMKHKLESKFPGEISINSDMQITPYLFYGRKQRRTKEPLDENERGVWKSWLKKKKEKKKLA